MDLQITGAPGDPGRKRGTRPHLLTRVTGPGAQCVGLQLVVDDLGGVGDVVEDADLLLVEACDGAVVAGL